MNPQVPLATTYAIPQTKVWGLAGPLLLGESCHHTVHTCASLQNTQAGGEETGGLCPCIYTHESEEFLSPKNFNIIFLESFEDSFYIQHLAHLFNHLFALLEFYPVCSF